MALNHKDEALLNEIWNSGDAKEVCKLLDAGANPNTRSLPHQGMNESYALHYAACKGNKTIIVLLLERGADRSTKTSLGYTAADIARQYIGNDLAAYINNWNAQQICVTSEIKKQIALENQNASLSSDVQSLQLQVQQQQQQMQLMQRQHQQQLELVQRQHQQQMQVIIAAIEKNNRQDLIQTSRHDTDSDSSKGPGFFK